MKKLSEVIVSRVCYDTEPCQHNCYITFSSGLREQGLYTAVEIANNFWDFLHDDEKLHFNKHQRLCKKLFPCI